MPPRFCCCDCLLGEDDFGPPLTASPSVDGDWKLISGTASISDGKAVVDGILATTICHPSVYELGSFEAFFDISNPSGGDQVIFTGGDPNSPKVTVTIEFTGFSGSGTIDVTIDSDDEDVTPLSYGFQYNWPVAQTIGVQFCYAPGLEATVVLSANSSNFTPSHTVCLDTNNADYCWTSGADNVGNFAFRKGTFDNWSYFVHWVDRKDCDFCSCFCRILDATGAVEYQCLPQEINVTLTGDSECSGIDGTYIMKQRDRSDAPLDAAPSVDLYPEKVSWITDPITCPDSTTQKFILELRCIGTGKADIDEVPQFTMVCVAWNTAGSPGSNFGFDCDDPDTTDCAVAGTDNISEASCVSGTCDPLSLTFPDLRENSYNQSAGNSCCGGFVDSGGSFEPDVRIGVEVTI